MGVVRLHRDPDGQAVVEGLPAQRVRHSPTGYEWGYSGSGPADLARNILLAAGTEQEADTWYQPFKFALVAILPDQGATLNLTAIGRTLREFRDAPPGSHYLGAQRLAKAALEAA